MKNLFLTLLFSVITCSLTARDKVIQNPYYELKATGLYHITKIELKKKETRVYIHSTFIPNWWVSFLKSTYLKDCETGEKYYISAVHGGEIDKKIYMPASGDSSFVLIFPALKKTTSRIDYGEAEEPYIFGISLDPKKKRIDTAVIVPDSIQQWIGTELSKAKKKTLVDYNSPEFFTKDTAKLIGYIKGHDRRLGFSTGMIYARNELTREDFPTVVTIHEDGRFEISLPMNYPQYTSVTFLNRWINFYIEPGQTLSMVLNWNEFLTADRMRNIRYRFKDIQFKGAAARINEEILTLDIREPDYKKLDKSVKTLTPAQFASQQLAFWEESENQLEQDLKGRNFTEQAETILRNEVKMSNAFYLYEYLSNREYQARIDSTGNEVLKIPVEQAYYNFLHKIPLNDPSLLISRHFGGFINRFEYSSPFMRTTHAASSKTFDWYLFTELGLKPTADDLDYINLQKSLPGKLKAGLTEESKKAFLKILGEKAAVFFKRYDSYQAAYKEKYQKWDYAEMELERWRQKDSILKHYFKLKPNLAYEIVKVRSLKPRFEGTFKDKKDAARTFLTALEKEITDPSLLRESEQLFYKSYPETPKEAYALPDGKGTEIFRKVIDQYKGKMLFVDFWGIFCGPCIASIKQHKPAREKYKDNEDFEFIFITSAKESPLERYNAFVKEQELEHTFRLSSDEFQYLRQLFKFNGIPHYVLISKEGLVLNDDFPMYRFEAELNKLLAKK